MREGNLVTTRADIHNRAAAVLHHVFRGELSAKECSLQVSIDYAIPIQLTQLQ